MPRLNSLSEYLDSLFPGNPETGWPSFQVAIPPENGFWETPLPDFLWEFCYSKENTIDQPVLASLVASHPLEWKQFLEKALVAYFSSAAMVRWSVLSTPLDGNNP